MHAPMSPRVVPGCWGLPITLREFVPHDWQVLQRLIDRKVTGKKVPEGVPQLGLLELNRLADFMTTEVPNELRFGVWHDCWVGTCTLKLCSPEEGELSYWVANDFRGQGYATAATITLVRYALDVLELPRLVADVLHENLASQKVLARASFHVESPGAGWYSCAIQKPVKIPAQ